jgi:hypothetical protein
MISIVNRARSDDGVYVARPSIFGNPFEIGKDGTRAEVIVKYEEYFIRQVAVNVMFQNEFKKLVNLAAQGDLRLACWCHPKPCHAAVIKKYIEIELSKLQMKNLFGP